MKSLDGWERFTEVVILCKEFLQFQFLYVGWYQQKHN